MSRTTVSRSPKATKRKARSSPRRTKPSVSTATVPLVALLPDLYGVGLGVEMTAGGLFSWVEGLRHRQAKLSSKVLAGWEHARERLSKNLKDRPELAASLAQLDRDVQAVASELGGLSNDVDAVSQLVCRLDGRLKVAKEAHGE